jgi:hypothetical protein
MRGGQMANSKALITKRPTAEEFEAYNEFMKAAA